MSHTEIINLRNSMKLTQPQFAQLFGVHPITVMRWEKDIKKPTDYQIGLMNSFQTASETDEVKNAAIGGLLVTIGVIAVLALLLGLAVKKRG